MKNLIRVYDRNMKKLAYLDNAYAIGYQLTLNELWYANFSMPADDPKNIYCQPFNYVEIYDDNQRVELFRIMPSTLVRSSQGDISYQCEHVLATLLDDVLFKYHQIGNIGVGTTTVLRYILDRQLDKKWQLGVCEFDRRFEYKWENENLLAALFSVPQCFNEGYRWEFDTKGSVWRINLKRLSTEVKADVTYKKNMTEIQKEVDPTTVVTRLYCLGYGEGDNQLGIESVNNGVPYLESNGQTTTYGIKSSILVDKRFESPETLKAYGQALLNQLKYPYKSYTTKAVDLYRKDNKKYSKFFPGDIVRIMDKEDDIIEDLPIIKVSKSDITGNPGDIEIEIANKTRDVAGSISELADRARINEVYAQGATNQMIIPYADNADNANPAVMRIYIPGTMARINKCILNYQLEAFRAYSKAIGGGGASVTSTNSGGGSATSTSSGGGSYSSTDSGGGEYKTTQNAKEDIDIREYTFGSYPPVYVDQTETEDGHSHGIPDHAHRVSIYGHSHGFNAPSHKHNFEVKDHSHNVNIPNHQHSISLPSHIHELQFGIYRGTTANSVTIKVDGKTIPQTSPGQDIDIVAYLATDSGGRINRNTWHTIEIIPNALTRIVANVFMQIFTNSRGGGDY
ncbi:phage minor structural protein, N-terminal region [Acetoanaerobium noterae]|uniref:Phage minor structural protein, N-terminal region n=1 Tax=Acetoanaerobium noterae TaxID=745369 RepID=A0A1T5ANP5_9FIRM|nr:phage tail protein [Acetoanaerobium noterae]SKB36233.1 phage minor structural protein, N-terminal region [Acetoanaerobium noterae]